MSLSMFDAIRKMLLKHTHKTFFSVFNCHLRKKQWDVISLESEAGQGSVSHCVHYK